MQSTAPRRSPGASAGGSVVSSGAPADVADLRSAEIIDCELSRGETCSVTGTSRQDAARFDQEKMY